MKLKGVRIVKFGVNTFIWSSRFDRSNFHLLDSIRDAGFDGIELPLIHPSDLADPEVRRAIERSQLACTFCAVLPAHLSCISDDPEVRKKTRMHLVDCIKTAAQFGSPLIAGPLYSPVGFLPGRRRTEEEYRRAVDVFQSLQATLEEAEATLAIEPLNRFETFFLNTVSDTVAFCAAIGNPRIGILFDTFHANIEEKDIAHACKAAGAHLKHVHVSENDRGVPGTGHVCWEKLFLTLRELNYDSWLTIESFGFALPELSAAASIWRDLAPTPDTIAFEGVKFLKQCLASAYLRS
ncbi:MAG: sugar phosphate isomerase/epimerase [Acidobacteriaceae bacterium]|nr:sugar phosphate isomerase/epimerase [Acidobacteriaceae bacterium]